MRALVVVALDEVIEFGLLLQEVFAGGLGSLELQRQMHAFMPAVLLWVARLDALDLDAESEPPDGELGQIEEGICTGERNAIIGANGLGQSELFENGLKHGESVDLLGGGERLASEDIAAGEVGDGQRVTVAAVGEHELALVVGTPQLVWLSGKGERCSVRSLASSSSALHQAVEHGMYCADRRRVDIRIE